MSSMGIGSSFCEALHNYMKNTEMCDSELVPDLKGSLQSSKSVSPLYVAINVNHTVNETFDYIKLFNKLNSEYLKLFLPYLSSPEFHEQSFSKTKNSQNEFKFNPKADKLAEDCDPVDEDNKVMVLGNANEIVLQDKFHITLFFLGVDKKPAEMVKEDVEKVSKYLKKSSSGFEEMLKTLTLYEFSVCLMYRYLYKMPLPFEDPNLCKENDDHEEKVTMRYLVLVPGVVFFSIVELCKPLFAIPPKDFNTKNKTNTNSGNPVPYSLSDLLKHLKENVLIENYHSTHITLGTSKEYKAVISNQICQSLLHFLDNCDTNHVHLYSQLSSKGSSSSNSTCSNNPFCDDLKNHLKVYNSGSCKYDNLKEVFLSSVPYLLNSYCGCSGNHDENVVLDSQPDLSKAPPKANEFKDLYSNTSVYVSDDFKWFYFKNLPGTHTLHSDTSQERYDWLIDVHVVALDKEVSGNLHFNQK